MQHIENEDIKFVSLPDLPNTLYAEMVKEALERAGVTCFISAEGIEGAFGISGTMLPNESVKLLVPEDKYAISLELQQDIMDK